MSNASESLIQLNLASEESVEAVPPPMELDFDVDEYLAEERAKDLLRFSTAGSVDDGKSTLIGRLLYDTQNVYDDQISAIEGKGTTAPGTLDLALLTDGLRAEREQGITIDVAYRYFSTPRRKFIIADTPGHEQYTRNMATGASTADVAVVLVDARKGVLTQSRRHAYITALLGVGRLIVAVNKMDLVGYDEATFDTICKDFTEFFESIRFGDQQSDRNGAPSAVLHFVPVSALAGDNVVHRSEHTDWYAGPSLLELLESVPTTESLYAAPFRLPVQRVIRPNLDFRGFAGQIASGVVRPGDTVVALPSGRTSKVKSIVTFDGELAEAYAPLSVVLTLEDELDISRGDLLATPQTPPAIARRFTASLVWMDTEPLALHRRYLLKHTSHTVQAQVTALRYAVDINTLERQPATQLAMNGIGSVEVETLRPLVLDAYATNRHTGAFVLIDPQTNSTVAAGMVRELRDGAEVDGPVTAGERIARWGHTGAKLVLSGVDAEAVADDLERALFESGAVSVRVATDVPADALNALIAAGLLVIVTDENAGVTRVSVANTTRDLSAENTTAGALQALHEAGVLRASQHATGGSR